jgi:hypothetical protein
MSGLTRTITLGAVGLMLADGALAPAASAETVRIKDPRHDARPNDGSGDMSQLRIKHGPQLLGFAVRHRGASLTNVYHFSVDTDVADPGPEYVVHVVTEVSPRVSVTRVEDFGEEGDVVCELRTSSLDIRRAVLRAAVPRSCLGDPARVRISLHAFDDHEGDDYLPAPRRFTRWVGSTGIS